MGDKLDIWKCIIYTLQIVGGIVSAVMGLITAVVSAVAMLLTTAGCLVWAIPALLILLLLFR